MAFTITPLEDGLVTLTDEKNNSYTGIESGLHQKLFRTVDLSRLQNESGWMIDAEGRMDSWKITGIIERDNKMIFYGPSVNGRLADPKNLSEHELWLLGTVMHLAQEKSLPLQGFFTRAWMMTEDNRILIFPPELMDFIRKAQPEPVKQSSWYPFNHPDISGPENLSFTLGVLSYYFLSGVLPFNNPKEEELAEEIRTQPPIPLETRVPGLKEDIARITASALSQKEETPSLGEWKKVLDHWSREGACDEVSDAEKEEQRKKLDELTAKRENKLGMRVFWRKKKTILVFTTAAVAVLVSLISAPIRKSLEPPLTMGMEPEEVILSYYGSFETLDQEMMEDCITKEAGKGDLNEVMNYFVTSRVRQGYEGKFGLITAREWTEAGRPMPDPGISVYGLTDLKITRLSEERYKVVYKKWIPGTPGDDQDPGEVESFYPTGYSVSDTLMLEKQEKGNWLIVSLDRSIEPL